MLIIITIDTRKTSRGVKMKILLINPDRAEPLSYFPLGLSYIASTLEKRGCDISCLDLRFTEDVSDKIRKENPDVAGITCRYDTYDDALSIARIIKQTKDIPVIAGGPFPTNCPEKVLSCEYFDYVVIGEGEYTVLKLMDALEAKAGLESINGTGCRQQGKIKINPPPECIAELDLIPFPKRDIFDVSRYACDIKNFPMPLPYLYIVASRGCPYNCKFCQPVVEKLFGKKPRYRSPENVTAEIEELIKKYRIRAFSFMDDTLTVNKEWLFRLCEVLIRKKINKKTVWLAQSRVDTFDRDVAEAMKRAGCRLVIFGVESGSQRVLDYLRKGIKVEQTQRALRIAKEVGLVVLADTMYGTPYETEEDLEKTVQMYRRLRPEMVWASITTPIPGTDLYEEVKAKGFLYTEKLSELLRRNIDCMKRWISREKILHYSWHLCRDEIRLSSLRSLVFTKLILLRWRSFIAARKIEGIIFDIRNMLTHGFFCNIRQNPLVDRVLGGFLRLLKKLQVA